MLFLAMTAGEMARCPELPPHPAWMSCQFSSRNPGLSNLPHHLPPDAAITVSDRTPISGHDPKTVSNQLQELIEAYSPAVILLDFQRSGAQEMVRHLVNVLPCPTGVTEVYAADLSCPVFLSPRPLCRCYPSFGARELWLDTPLCNQTVTVTKNGAQVSELLPYAPLSDGFYHKKLSVQYKIQCQPEQVQFTISRGVQELNIPGITHYFCLYQELNNFHF